MIIHQLSQSLLDTALSHTIQRVFWIVPVVQTVHLLAIGIVVASGALLGLRLLDRAATSQTIAATVQRFVPWILGAVAVLAATGALLIVGEPARTLGNPAFWAKLVALAAALALTLGLRQRLRRNPHALDAPTAAAASGLQATVHATLQGSRSAHWLGALSLLLWASVVVLGRWIAYVLEV